MYNSRRLENAAEKLQSDLCVYGMFEPEEMCKLEDSFEETFKKLHEEEKAAAERKKVGKTKPSSRKNALTAGSNKADLASKNGQIREESLIKKQKMIL